TVEEVDSATSTWRSLYSGARPDFSERAAHPHGDVRVRGDRAPTCSLPAPHVRTGWARGHGRERNTRRQNTSVYPLKACFRAFPPNLGPYRGPYHTCVGTTSLTSTVGVAWATSRHGARAPAPEIG